jgi:hypothetical protein
MPVAVSGSLAVPDELVERASGPGQNVNKVSNAVGGSTPRPGRPAPGGTSRLRASPVAG